MGLLSSDNSCHWYPQFCSARYSMLGHPLFSRNQEPSPSTGLLWGSCRKLGITEQDCGQQVCCDFTRKEPVLTPRQAPGEEVNLKILVMMVLSKGFQEAGVQSSRVPLEIENGNAKAFLGSEIENIHPSVFLWGDSGCWGWLPAPSRLHSSAWVTEEPYFML